MSTPPPSPTRSPRRVAALGASAAALCLLLSGCDADTALRFGWPKGITPQAERMRELWTWSVIAALVVGVVVWALIFWCVVRYRKRSDELPVQTRFNLPIEVLYTVMPFLVIAVLFYYTATTQGFVEEKVKNPDVTVQVVAFKWNWQFRYQGVRDDEGELVETVGSTEEIPVLVVPTDKVIQFDEVSKDVIHSFWVPELLFKLDVIPGRENSFQVTVDRPGAYVGRCAELCGTYHANMNFEMRAVSWEKYQAFLKAKQAGDSTAQALRSIGEEPYSTTTKPFDPSRTARTAG